MEDKNFREQSMAKDDYLVAIKLLLRDGDKLLVTHDIFGHWDIPGGRIRKDQFETPIEEILKLKVIEELGTDVRYELGDVKEILRVEREEHGRNGQKVRIVGICYEGKYLGGEPAMGNHHDEIRWIDLKSANLEEYKSDAGWVHLLSKYQKSK